MRLAKMVGIAAVAAAVSGAGAALSADTGGVALDQLLSDIQQALIKVRDADDVSAQLRLENVRLNLRGTVAYDASGGVKLLVVSLGGGGSETSTQEIELTLEPPRAADRSKVSASAAPLADAIIEAARDVKRAASRDPPLHLKELSATISFTVEKHVDGSAGFHILPVTIDMGGKVRKEDVQKITIAFVPRS
jgi:hypothetical protein